MVIGHMIPPSMGPCDHLFISCIHPFIQPSIHLFIHLSVSTQCQTIYIFTHPSILCTLRSPSGAAPQNRALLRTERSSEQSARAVVVEPLSVLLLLLHPPVLEPDLHLSGVQQLVTASSTHTHTRTHTHTHALHTHTRTTHTHTHYTHALYTHTHALHTHKCPHTYAHIHTIINAFTN